MTRPTQTAAAAICAGMALQADSIADKPLLLLAGVGMALGLAIVVVGRQHSEGHKRKAAPESASPSLAHKKGCKSMWRISISTKRDAFDFDAISRL